MFRLRAAKRLQGSTIVFTETKSTLKDPDTSAIDLF